MTSGNTVRLDFHSSLDLLDFVQMVSDHIGRMAGFDDDSLHWVSVAVRESVINAIKHGNCSNIQKRVQVEFTAQDEPGGAVVIICVRDEGCGFEPGDLPNPLAPENILKASGRGIFLMRSFMDEMTITRAAQGGMEVRMVKRVHQSELA